MEYFSIIYKILKAIEQSMDYDEFDSRSISPEALHVKETRWEILMTELVKNGYIDGVALIPVMGRRTPIVKIIRPTLTIKGAEYLSENSMMKKAYNLAKGVKAAVPGV